MIYAKPNIHTCTDNFFSTLDLLKCGFIGVSVIISTIKEVNRNFICLFLFRKLYIDASQKPGGYEEPILKKTCHTNILYLLNIDTHPISSDTQISIRIFLFFYFRIRLRYARIPDVYNWIHRGQNIIFKTFKWGQIVNIFFSNYN